MQWAVPGIHCRTLQREGIDSEFLNGGDGSSAQMEFAYSSARITNKINNNMGNEK